MQHPNAVETVVTDEFGKRNKHLYLLTTKQAKQGELICNLENGEIEKYSDQPKYKKVKAYYINFQ
jgi:hypothetical protein